MRNENDKLGMWLAEQNLEYKARFVPQSQSRNATTRDERGNLIPSINWLITIGKGVNFITTEYMQGIGHVPWLKPSFGRKTIAEAEEERCAAETGRASHHLRFKRVPAPTLQDVMFCLVSDSQVIEYADFEDWAMDHGFDPDSRKTEKIYQECMSIALKLRQIVDLDEARELYQDY